VANHPWQKTDREVSAAEHRMEMVEAAITGIDGLEASSLEIDRGGDSYTADTLEALAASEPDSELFLVVGADLVGDLASWQRVDVVRRLATLAVVARPGSPDVDPGPGWTAERVEIPALDVSASQLRQRAAAGLPLDVLVPAPVIDVITRLGLYPGGR